MKEEMTQDEISSQSSTGPHRFTMEGWIACAPFERLLHMEIVEARDGRATLTMPFLLNFAQGGGYMHGGALVSLADTAVVMAIKSIVDPMTHFATTALNTRFLRPVKQGVVTARAQVISHAGRDLQGEAAIYDASEKPVLEFSSTFRIAKDSQIKNVAFKNT